MLEYTNPGALPARLTGWPVVGRVHGGGHALSSLRKPGKDGRDRRAVQRWPRTSR